MPKFPVVGTHRNFVVLGHARCGSNLLIGALSDHPQIRVVGEVLGKDEETRKTAWARVNLSRWKEPRGDGYQVGESGAKILATKIFRSSPDENFRAFSFKLFYDDARFDENISSA